MKVSRREAMEKFIIDQDTATMEELCRRFAISMNTARSDVAALVEKGAVRKIYGGVCSNQISHLVGFEKRRRLHLDAKRAICGLAATLIEDNDVVYIDSGSTTMYLLDDLTQVKNVTVLTTNLSIVQRAGSYDNLSVFVLPGRFDRDSNSISDVSTADYLGNFNIDKAFIGASGITPEGNLSNYSTMESTIKKTALRNSRKRFLLMDSSKFGSQALMTLCSITEMDEILTDAALPEKYQELCRNFGVVCRLAGQ